MVLLPGAYFLSRCTEDPAMSTRFFVMTDIEGVVGVDAWSQVRHADDDFDEDAEQRAMKELAREVNACIEGIRSVRPDAVVDVFDGHGAGGFHESDLTGGNYLRGPDFDPFDRYAYDAQLYVGQHAMAGTAFAPLRHTQSSLHVEYYRVNGTFFGEFGGGAIKAGQHGIPTVFLSGDDKACHEAEVFVPEIETVAVKYGRGEEAAVHRDGEEVLADIRDGAARAVERAEDVPPVSGFESPFTVEIRYREERDDVPDRFETPSVDAERVDPYTIRLESDTFSDVYP